MGRCDQTALMLATCTGHGEIARLLLRAGAKLSLRGRGAPGFAEKTARDLALARGLKELSAALQPEP